MGSTQDKNSLRRLRMPRTYRDLAQPFVGNRMSDDLRMLRDAINQDRAIDALPAPTGLRATSMAAAVLLEWNPLDPSFTKSIDGARVWRAPRALLDDTNWYSNPNKVIICSTIRSTTYTDPVGNVGDEFIYWVQWINLDGKESGASAGTVGFALWDDAAPGPVEDVHVTGGNGRFQGSWKDPLTNILTLDTFAQQYSSTSGFTTAGGNICITWMLGRIYSHGGSDAGKTYWFRYAAHNKSGDAETNPDPRLVAILPDGWGPWTPAPENPVSSDWPTGTDEGPPGLVTTAASANGLSILFGAETTENASTLDEAELRIKREDAPQANVSNLTTPDVEITKIPAITGARFTWVAPKPGRYFYSFRLHNAFGWSAWSSDPTLLNVTTSVQTTNEMDTGPPQDWTIETRPGTDRNSVFVYTSRPKVNGANLLWVFYQVKDTSQGAWRTYDENAGAAETYYDGSAINHRLNDDGTKVYRESGAGFGTAKVDDMLLIDVRGGQFHRNYCQWALIRGFEGGNAATATYIEIGTGVRPQVNTGLRIKAVKPNWTWNTEGYLGNLVGAGVAGEFVAGKTDQQFVSAPIPIDGDFNSIDARVWFGNHYSISDASSPMNPPTVSTDQVKVVKLKDDVIPGPVENLSVTAPYDEFTAKWEDPLTGTATLDDTAIQYDTSPTFPGPNISKGWGRRNELKGTEANATYYWRVAVHNQSDQPSHASTVASLGATGWGPWKNYGAPTAVSSGSGGGVPTDAVIPGPVQGLSVTGRNGKYLAEWLDPNTGYATIDDCAIQYTTDAAFTVNGPGSPAKGWGPRNLLESTAPNSKYYFRVAVHNTSGATSDAGTYSLLGTTGWGPWANAPGNPVSSGLIPLNPVQTSEQLCFNGGFEMCSDGYYPDGWVLWEVGAGGYGWSIHSICNEGSRGVVLVNNATARFAIASAAFPVRENEQLTESCWVTSSGAGGNGIWVRMVFHSSDPNFTASEVDITLASQADVAYGVWKQIQGQFTVPAGMKFCRVALFNYSFVSTPPPSINYHYDDVQVLRRITGDEIQDNTIPPNRLDGNARTEFTETWEEPLGNTWVLAYPGNAYRSSGGVDGGYILYSDGTKQVAYNDYIPYDPRKLYRMTVRIYCGQVAAAANGTFYIGVACYDSNKNYLSDCRPVLNGFQWYGNRNLSVWYEDTGFFKGHGGGGFAGPAPDPTAPALCQAGTSYIAPALYLFWGEGQANSGAGYLCGIDDIRIDVLEEEQYTTKAPNGTLSTSMPYLVYHPWGDDLTSAMSFYWTYTQGTVKADQFLLYFNDGVAYAMDRVKALPGAGPVNYVYSVYAMSKSRVFSGSVTPEAVGAAGTMEGSVSRSWPDVTPSVNGAGGGGPGDSQIVGRMDWAGGNIWYDSKQYRNNTPPDNGPGGALTCQFIRNGSGGQYAVLDNVSSCYTQGTTNIATHLAVLILTPQGTPVLNRDSVVTYISFGSLPQTFWVPINIADNQTFTVAVAAVAECKHGRIYNTAYVYFNKPADTVWMFALGGSQQVWIGHTTTNNFVRINGDAYIHELGSGVRRARVGGNSQATYLLNESDRGLYLSPGVANPSFALTSYEAITQNPGLYNALFFTNVSGGFWYNPSYGGCLYSGGGALPSGGGGGWWATSTGQYRNFAPGAPYCEKCGYDFWLMVTSRPEWDAYMAICGWCGEVYKKGPKNALKLLTEEQRGAILRKRNPDWKLLTGGVDVEALKSKRPLRRRDTRPKRRSTKTRVRSARRRSV